MNNIIEKIRSRKYELFIFGMMTSIYFFSYFQRVAIPGTIFNQLQSDLDISAAAITNLGSAYLYVYAVAQLFMGILIDKFGGRKVFLAGGLILCIGSLMFPLCHSLPMLYLSRFITGIGASTMFLSIVKETDMMFGKKNFSLMLGIVFFIGYSGGLAGTLPFERLVAFCGWRNALLIIAAATWLTFLLVYFKGRRLNQGKLPIGSSLSLKPVLEVLKNKYTWPVFISGPINFGVYFSIQTVLGKKFLEDYAGMSSVGAASSIFAMTLAAMIMLFSSGLFSRLAGNRRKIFMQLSTLTGLLNSALLLAGLIFHMPGGLFLFCYVVYALASGCSTVFMTSAKELNLQKHVAVSAGMLNCFYYLSVALISGSAGFIMDMFKAGAIKTGHSIIYPADAYLWLFIMILLLSTIAFISSFYIRETAGKHIFEQQQQA